MPSSAVDLHGALDRLGQLAVALLDRRALHEFQLPALRVVERGVAAVEQRAQEIEGGRRLPVGLQLPLRIGDAGLRREVRPVDDVAAVARQLLAVLLLGVGGARLGELPGHAADLHHPGVAGEGEDQRHLQEQLEIVADVVGLVLLEALGAVAALQQEALAPRHLGEPLLEVEHLLDENQRREVAQVVLDRLQGGLVRVGRDLENGLGSPAVRLPGGGHRRYSCKPPRLPRPASHGPQGTK